MQTRLTRLLVLDTERADLLDERLDNGLLVLAELWLSMDT